jgi:thiol-disulfide isomerase/thioredoxin
VEGAQIDLQAWVRHGGASIGSTAATCYTDEFGKFQFPGLSRSLEYRVVVRDNLGDEVSAAKRVKMEGDVVQVDLPPITNTKGVVRLAVPAKAPELDCAAWIGKPVRLEAMRGKVVLLDFWATWCGPCLSSLPSVELIHELYADRGLIVVGLHHNSTPEDQVRSIARKYGLRYSIGLDTANGSTCGRYNVDSFPTKVLIGRDGQIRATKLSHNFLSAVRREVLYGE